MARTNETTISDDIKDDDIMRTLFFEQITDDRFDSNIKELLEKRIKKIKELLDIEGVEVIVSDIRNIHLDEYTEYKSDGSIFYQVSPNNQCRCNFQVRKTTRKVTWNDIYGLINSVKATHYTLR